MNDLDGWVREMLQWHFQPETGSPYWLRRAASLPFNPLTDLRGAADLARFPAVADEWREVDARDLIPRGCRGSFSVWETGGTTGPPRRIVDAQQRRRGLRHISAMLDRHGFPHRRSEAGRAPAGWLHLGPTGPHLVGTNVGRLARLRGSLLHTIDLDPRWVKRLYRTGRADEARRYTAHLVEQVRQIMRTQPIHVLTTTPPLLQALCEDDELRERIRGQVRGIIWFGTSMSEEGLRFLEDEVLPEIPLVGWYGNTLMGIACQRPRRPGDPFRCIFTPPAGALVHVVDPAEPERRVAYGESGQVRLSVLNRELFLPWHLERDRAVRVLPFPDGRPAPGPDGSDDLALVSPLGESGAGVEGVY